MVVLLFLGCLVMAAVCLVLATHHDAGHLLGDLSAKTWQPHAIEVVQIDLPRAIGEQASHAAMPQHSPMIGRIYAVRRDAVEQPLPETPARAFDTRRWDRDAPISDTVLERYHQFATELPTLR
ncbi:hypothetical protein G6N82_07580 [Altererythrobacter sp. BO-6]|uniref:hypothetical protein n=1 Tax=Altererythrobacter sp. BO-6 TaxID=2604537 RepID=UPI0013E11D4F|nr:hypothetical protein [Altererythrobacter sp. BO-6]QIG54032.1 hypothetical protein G6N82_07580 [Altererythrobacter sp. BO-6]